MVHCLAGSLGTGAQSSVLPSTLFYPVLHKPGHLNTWPLTLLRLASVIPFGTINFFNNFLGGQTS